MNTLQRLRWYFAGALLLCLPAAVNAQSPVIQEIINAVNLDSLTYTVNVLSGEVGSKNQGTTDTIYSRQAWASDVQTHDLAYDYLKSKLESYGIPTRLQPYIRNSIAGTNVLAEQQGVITPGRKYIISAHYDCYSGTPGLAPGADDNASGCAAVLEAARALSRYKTAYTVVYALWDNEEGGRQGSIYYAQDARARGDTILGAVVLDMIGYEGNGDSLMEIHAQNTANSGALADTAALVQRLYGIALNPRVYYPNGNGQSDHAAFYWSGYGAFMVTEALRNNDDDPFYHMVKDKIQVFNLPYFHQMGRLAAGTIALLADVQGTASAPQPDPLAKAFSLEQNYPNPFNPSTTIRYALPHRSYVSLTVFNTLGQPVGELVRGELDAGYHEAKFDAGGLASGVYFYRLQAGEFVQTKKLILLH